MKIKIKKLLTIILGSLALFPKITFAQWNPSSLGVFGLPNQTVFSIISGILFWLLAILGIVGVIGFIIAGLLYLTSAGNEEQSKQAKRAMMYSIIGILVGLSGVVAIRFAQNLLSGQSF